MLDNISIFLDKLTLAEHCVFCTYSGTDLHLRIGQRAVVQSWVYEARGCMPHQTHVWQLVAEHDIHCIVV